MEIRLYYKLEFDTETHTFVPDIDTLQFEPFDSPVLENINSKTVADMDLILGTPVEELCKIEFEDYTTIEIPDKFIYKLFMKKAYPIFNNKQ